MPIYIVYAKINKLGKDLGIMRIENDMLTRFSDLQKSDLKEADNALAKELDFFFDNVMDSVVSYFKEEEVIV